MKALLVGLLALGMIGCGCDEGSVPTKTKMIQDEENVEVILGPMGQNIYIVDGMFLDEREYKSLLK